MLKEAKKALRVTVDYYDSELASLMMAGMNDLKIAGVVTTQDVSFTIGTNDAVTDTSSLTDPLLMRAIITYTAMRFGNPPNYDKLKAACSEVGTDWLKFVAFEGVHEFCKDDEPIDWITEGLH